MIVDVRVVNDVKTNRYDPATGTLAISIACINTSIRSPSGTTSRRQATCQQCGPRPSGEPPSQQARHIPHL
jgi:hypothetical protein